MAQQRIPFNRRTPCFQCQEEFADGPHEKGGIGKGDPCMGHRSDAVQGGMSKGHSRRHGKTARSSI